MEGNEKRDELYKKLEELREKFKVKEPIKKRGKHSTGSVGRAFGQSRRHQMEENKIKRRELKRKYFEKHKEKIRKRKNERVKILNEFANQKCRVCNKLLNYATESGYCRKHVPKTKHKKNGKKNKKTKTKRSSSKS